LGRGRLRKAIGGGAHPFWEKRGEGLLLIVVSILDGKKGAPLYKNRTLLPFRTWKTLKKRKWECLRGDRGGRPRGGGPSLEFTWPKKGENDCHKKGGLLQKGGGEKRAVHLPRKSSRGRRKKASD